MCDTVHNTDKLGVIAVLHCSVLSSHQNKALQCVSESSRVSQRKRSAILNLLDAFWTQWSLHSTDKYKIKVTRLPSICTECDIFFLNLFGSFIFKPLFTFCSLHVTKWVIVAVWLSGLQQSGFVPWASGGEGRDWGEEDREPADCGLSQLDARLRWSVWTPPSLNQKRLPVH